jgi:hypothetical protein
MAPVAGDPLGLALGGADGEPDRAAVGADVGAPAALHATTKMAKAGVRVRDARRRRGWCDMACRTPDEPARFQLGSQHDFTRPPHSRRRDSCQVHLNGTEPTRKTLDGTRIFSAMSPGHGPDEPGARPQSPCATDHRSGTEGPVVWRRRVRARRVWEGCTRTVR